MTSRLLCRSLRFFAYSVLRVSEFNTEDAERSHRERRGSTGTLNIPLDNSRYNDYCWEMLQKRKSARNLRAPYMRLEAQVFVNLLRTADALARGAEALLKPTGLSATQYNVLRILRGAGPEGLACREVGCRMISRDPDITRLMDRMESRGLIARARGEEDRRLLERARAQAETPCSPE